MTAEKSIENSILTYLKSKDIFCWKNNSGGVYDPTKRIFRKNRNPHVINGVSDILGILPNGAFLAIEVKVPKTATTRKTYASEDQRVFIKNINHNKGVAFIARSVADVENILVQILGNKYYNKPTFVDLDS